MKNIAVIGLGLIGGSLALELKKLTWATIYGIILLGFLAGIAFVVWRWEFDRRERNSELNRAAEERGELII